MIKKINQLLLLGGIYLWLYLIAAPLSLLAALFGAEPIFLALIDYIFPVLFIIAIVIILLRNQNDGLNAYFSSHSSIRALLVSVGWLPYFHYAAKGIEAVSGINLPTELEIVELIGVAFSLIWGITLITKPWTTKLILILVILIIFGAVFLGKWVYD